MNRRYSRFAVVAFFVAGTAACAPVRTYSGFLPERNEAALADPQPGIDTRDSVRQRFGSPSTAAAFDQNSWYYLSSIQEQVAFFTPRVAERNVMVVRFEGETVAAVEKYGMERGRIVAYNAEETPTRGRELGLLEQLFGTIGNTPPIQSEDDRQEQNRRRR